MIRFLKALIVLLMSWTAPALAAQDTQHDYYRRWVNLPTEQLIKAGSDFAEIKNMADSALVCFTIVTGRYKHDMSDELKRYVVRAYVGKWYVYFFSYFDYSQAYENLARAQELAEECGHEKGRILLNFGCMYQTISEQSGDLKPDSLALDYYKRSYWQSVNENDAMSSRMAVSNMITVAYTLKCLDSIGKEVDDYTKHLHDDSETDYNMLMYKGLKALQNKQYDRALQAFDKQRVIVGDSLVNARYRYAIDANTARVYADMGQYERAVGFLASCDSLANMLDIKDAKIEVFGMMADCYHNIGDKLHENEYLNRYFRLKDSLLNYHQVASVEELRFLGEMKKVDQHIQDIEHQRKVQDIVIKTVVVIALVILAFMFVVWRKNKELRQRNEALYLKNVEMLKKEELERAKRRQLEAMDRMNDEPKPKYKTNTLDDDAKQKIMADIVRIMENSDEIFSTDFSAQRLAELVGEKYNYISQVINEKYGSNFNALLNEYRIQEACKRLNDTTQYGNLTIEGIANGIGFKSRTTFIQAFKKYTGLTPSEYQRLARQNNAK